MTLKQLIEILQVDKTQFSTGVDYQIELVSILTDEDPEIILDWDKDLLDDKFKLIKDILNRPSSSVDNLELNGYTFYKIPFNKLTLGSYIDLEYFLGKPDKLAEVITILYRQKSQANPLAEIVYEPYDNWLDVRKPLFLEANVLDVLGVKSEFLQWKSELINQYSGLFNFEPEEETEETDELSRINDLKARKAEEQRKNFSWEHIILNVINHDATKFESCLEMPVVLFFNVLASIKINEKS